MFNRTTEKIYRAKHVLSQAEGTPRVQRGFSDFQLFLALFAALREMIRLRISVCR
jgi:hypothetical protein